MAAWRLQSQWTDEQGCSAAVEQSGGQGLVSTVARSVRSVRDGYKSSEKERINISSRRRTLKSCPSSLQAFCAVLSYLHDLECTRKSFLSEGSTRDLRAMNRPECVST